MKTRKTLALFAFALLALGVTARQAKAVTYTCDGGSNPVPAMVTGNASVQQSGNCTIANGIQASGSIDILISGGGTLNVGAALTAATSASASAPGDIVTTSIAANNGAILVTGSGKVTTTTLTSVGGDVSVTSAGNLATQTVSAGSNFGAFSTAGTVKVTGTISAQGNVLMQAFSTLDATSTITSSTGGVELDPFYNQTSSTLFKIGASSANGVTGVITARNGVYVVNGNSSSTGGITLTNGNKIVVQNASTNSGSILLNAQNGSVTLTAGHLSADGATGQVAGLIVVLGNNITAGASTTISANQALTAGSSNHYVALASNTFTVGGTTVQANGNGFSSANAVVDLGPPGYISFTSNHLMDSLSWNVIPGTSFFNNNLPYTVNGTGALTASTNGSFSTVGVGGYPIAFNNAGAVTLQSTGSDVNRLVQLGYIGSLSGTAGLSFNNTGVVVINANGASGNNPGGTVHIQLDQFSVASSVTSFTTEANGLGTGNAGFVGFFPSKATFSDATTLFTANGAGSTSLSTPNINIGVNGTTTVNSTSFTVSANALPSAAKNAGIVTFGSNPITLSASTIAAITANGPTSANGAGGTITLNPGFFQALKLGNNAGDLSLSATGGGGTGTGNNGGAIVIGNAPQITLDTPQATALNVSVLAGTGNGGTITISSFTMTFTGSGYALNANAGATQGNGGNITFSAGNAVTIGTGSAAVVIRANGAGTGNGGTISVNAQPVTAAGSSISANSGTSGGNGGQITLNSTNGDLTIGTSNSSFEVAANATGTGNGGTASLTAGGKLTVAGGNISVTAGPTGNGTGGNISLTASSSSSGTLTVTGTLNANSKGTGLAGMVTIASSSTSSNVVLDGATISAAGDAAGGGSGNDITITSASGVSVNGTTLNASASGSSNAFGGSIHVTSAAQVDLTQPNTSITATGATQGAGGNAIFSNTAQFDVNKVINVSAGSGATASTFDGIIELNAVPCRQWQTSFGSWPTTYWDCTGNSGTVPPDILPPTFVNGLTTPLPRGTLQNGPTQVYVFSSGSGLAFFTLTASANEAGRTFQQTPLSTIYLSVFESNHDNSQITESTAHETGHALDYAHGIPSQEPTYLKFAWNDMLQLDYTDPVNKVKRAACSNNNTGPFDGVVNFSGQAICTNGTLNSVYFTNGVPWSNSKILESADPNLSPVDQVNQLQWAEVYATTFQWVAYTGTHQADSLDPTSVEFLVKGYMPCTTAWAQDEFNGTTVPPNTPAYCSVATPGWYTPGQ